MWIGNPGTVYLIQNLYDQTRLILQYSFKGSNKLLQRRIHRQTEFTQFNNINTAFAAFTFTDKRLCFTQSLGELTLREACLFPGLPQAVEEQGIGFGGDGFLHLMLSLSTSLQSIC